MVQMLQSGVELGSEPQKPFVSPRSGGPTSCVSGFGSVSVPRCHENIQSDPDGGQPCGTVLAVITPPADVTVSS